MKLQEALEYLQSSIGGGIFSDETLTEIKFAEKVLQVGRAICIKEMYRHDNTINDIYYQHVQLNYNPELQDDDCYTIFEYPNIIGINPNIDGHQYMGHKRGDNSWRRLLSTGHLATYEKARGTRRKDTNTYYVLEPQFGTVKVMNPEIRRGVGYSILEDPLHPSANFNRKKDEYPITMECLALLEKYFREGKFERFLRSPADIISNSVSESSLGQQGAPQQ